MSRVDLTVQQIDRDTNGLTPSYTAAQDSMAIPNNDGRIFLHVKNTGVTTKTMTIQTPGAVAGLAVAEYTASVVGTTGDVMVGPLPPSVFNQSGGNVYVDFDATTYMTIAAIRL